VVRHAEKAADGNDPDLSAAGQQRAEGLARILKDAEITAIFTTEFKRTQETAAPTAKELHVSPTVIPANEIPALVETPVKISETDYSDLFVITMVDKPQLLRLHYPD